MKYDLHFNKHVDISENPYVKFRIAYVSDHNCVVRHLHFSKTICQFNTKVNVCDQNGEVKIKYQSILVI